MSEQTIEQYYREFEKSGKADPATMMAAMGSIATAGQMWNALPEEERTIENARRISSDSLEPSNPQDGPNKYADTTDLLYAKAGTREMVQAYTKDLVERSADLDKAQGKVEGTNLMGFLDGVGDAVKDIDFDKFKQGDLKNKDGSQVDLLAVRDQIGKTVVEFIDPKMKPIDQDIVATIKRDLDSPEINTFDGVTVEPQQLSFGEKARVVGLMATYAAALAPKSDEKAKEEEKKNDGPDPKSAGVGDVEFKVRPDDEIAAFVSKMPKLPSEAPMQDNAGMRANVSGGAQRDRQQEGGIA